MNSFYIVCYVLQFNHKIEHTIEYKELRDYMRYPVSLSKLVHFKEKRIQCLTLWVIAHLPSFLFIISIRFFLLLLRSKRV